MLFPTVRFAIFFAVVMPVSWMLMPVPRRGRGVHHDRAQPWLVPVALLGVAALLGPLSPVPGWPTAIRALLWLIALGIGGLAVVRWNDLRGLTRWNVFILIASYVFYGAYSWQFVTLLAGSSVVNQVLASAIDRSATVRSRKTLLFVAVALNLGVLGWFKYKGFFVEGSSGLLEYIGIHITPPASAVIPPVGISFFTFQALSYVIDTFRGKLKPVPLLEFAVYLSFFPHLVAGPIVRASEFLPQLRQPRDARRVDNGLAFWLLATGLFKKVVVSGYLATASADPVFRVPGQHGSVDTLVGIYAYAVQIYCDFSGYTDMAIGLALLLGFRFPQNFDAPYTATSLQDFWRRWHMTLSRWLRDYLYIPLGGNQGAPWRAYLNLFLTMLIGGLWHGAAWTFVVWGALHGSYLAAERWWGERAALRSSPDVAPDARRPQLVSSSVARGAVGAPEPLAGDEDRSPAPAARPTLSPTARLWLGRLLTFHVVCLGWVFFRAESVHQALFVLSRLVHFGDGAGLNLAVLGTIAVFIGTQYVPSDAVGRAQAIFSRWPFWMQGAVLGGWLVFANALGPAGVQPFIYFNF